VQFHLCFFLVVMVCLFPTCTHCQWPVD
jgi:hypothetical protein